MSNCKVISLQMPDQEPSETLESRILGAYGLLESALGCDACERVVAVERIGRYELRLVDAWALLPQERIPFWIELYDRASDTSLDSFTSPELNRAVAAAEAMIAAAKRCTCN